MKSQEAKLFPQHHSSGKGTPETRFVTLTQYPPYTLSKDKNAKREGAGGRGRRCQVQPLAPQKHHAQVVEEHHVMEVRALG